MIMSGHMHVMTFGRQNHCGNQGFSSSVLIIVLVPRVLGPSIFIRRELQLWVPTGQNPHSLQRQSGSLVTNIAG